MGTALCFRVLCIAPAKYTVFEAEGYVKPQSCIDIVIWHVATISSHYESRTDSEFSYLRRGLRDMWLAKKTSPLLFEPQHTLWSFRDILSQHPAQGLLCGPTLARHLQENAPQQLATSSFLLLDGRHHFCGLPTTTTAGRAWQPAVSSSVHVSGTGAGGSLHLRPPHHGVPLDLSSQLNPPHSLSPLQVGI